jgi:hypothetical protein
MGNEKNMAQVHVESLAELDALVGRYVTGEKPQSHWEDSHAGLHFDSLEEALEALREPYFQQFIPEEERARTVLREVEEYRCYSADLELAWEVVARLSGAKRPLHVWREGEVWHAAVGEFESVAGATAPIAICLAGLRSRGVEIEIPANGFEGHESGSPAAPSLTDQLLPGLLAD